MVFVLEKETLSADEEYMNAAVCSLFNAREWEKLDLCCFLTVKYHTNKTQIFQHLPVREKLRIHIRKTHFKKLTV